MKFMPKKNKKAKQSMKTMKSMKSMKSAVKTWTIPIDCKTAKGCKADVLTKVAPTKRVATIAGAKDLGKTLSTAIGKGQTHKFWKAFGATQERMNRNTFQRPYGAKGGVLNKVNVHGKPGKAVYRYNHNGGQGARKAQFGRVLLGAIAKKGKCSAVQTASVPKHTFKANWDKVAVRILKDKKLYAKFLFAMHLGRSGRVNEQPTSTTGDPYVSERSGKIFRSYMKSLGNGFEKGDLTVFNAFFADWDGNDCISPKVSDRDACFLMNRLFVTAHYIDFRRLDGQFKSKPAVRMPANILAQFIHTKTPLPDIEKAMEIKMAMPAFKETGYKVMKTWGNPKSGFTVLRPVFTAKKKKGVSETMYKAITTGVPATLSKTGFGFIDKL